MLRSGMEERLCQMPEELKQEINISIDQSIAVNNTFADVVVQWNLLSRTLENVDTCIIHTPSCGPK